MQEPTHMMTHVLAEAIREGRISATEALEAYLAQIKRHNSTLNAVVTLDEEGARHRARQADDATAHGENRGPLHGLPMTLKDSHAVAGMRTTSGYPPLAGYVPQRDGTVASRLKAAGANIIGKTNVSELLKDIQSVNDIFGRTNNPWNVERTSGGSSGGAAAALAVGMTPLEIGSDLAGSIRIPAHFCGLFGLKPTEHRVSMYGHIPDVPDRPRSQRILWSVGPLARCIEDLRLAFRLLAGADGHDIDVPPVPYKEAAYTTLKELRLAWAPTFPGVPVQASIRTALERVAAEADRAGARIEEVLPGVSFEETAKVRTVLATGIRTVFAPEETLPVSLQDYFTALHRRDAIIEEWESFFAHYDALICPVSMTTAFPHCPTDSRLDIDGTTYNYWRAVGHCAPFNLTGHPCVVLPVGVDSEGMPMGVQVVGPRWQDERLLNVAQAVSEITGAFNRPPGY